MKFPPFPPFRKNGQNGQTPGPDLSPETERILREMEQGRRSQPTVWPPQAPQPPRPPQPGPKK